MAVRNLPFWVAVWLGITSVVFAIDFSFVLLRPHTLPGGKWNYLFNYRFEAYNTYIQVDPTYKDLKDAFVVGQSLMNVVEVCLMIITLIMHISGKARLSVLLAFVVSTMTSSKTLLYSLVSSGLCGGHNSVSLDDWKKTAFMFFLPSFIWVIVPFLCMVATGRIMVEYLENGETTAKKLKSH